jgi:NADPH:quinone reductase-like Zn-dependent oxidoreductase
MKAIVYSKYGSSGNLHLTELDAPIPKDDQILVKIHAVSINGADSEGLTGKPLYARTRGLFRPGSPILGSDIAGRVEYAGKNHTEFKPGDAVFGELPGYHGGFAEYACTGGKTLAPMPASLTFEQAAAIPQAGVIAINGIVNQGMLQPGQKVLINGAGGSAGAFAIQLARLHGAEVTGVDNAFKQDFMRSLGADHVFDYARQDYTHSGSQYDLILDLVAYRSLSDIQPALKPGGTYFLVGGSAVTIFQILLLGSRIRKKTGKSFRILMVPQNRKDLLAVADLCISGKIAPVIDRTYPLEQVPEAMRYIEAGRARGKIVITVAREP